VKIIERIFQFISLALVAVVIFFTGKKSAEMQRKKITEKKGIKGNVEIIKNTLIDDDTLERLQ